MKENEEKPGRFQRNQGVEMDAAEAEEIKEVVTILFTEKKEAKKFLNQETAEKIEDKAYLK